MHFTSLTILSVLSITFVLAIPAPDKHTHFKDPVCPVIHSRPCLLIPYCDYHLKRGDLFTTRGYLRSRGESPEPKNLDMNLTDALTPSSSSIFKTRKSDVIWKRARSSLCGVLSCYTDRQVSDQYISLDPGMLYDVITDYPYSGATGGKSPDSFPFFLLFFFILPTSRPQIF